MDTSPFCSEAFGGALEHIARRIVFWNWKTVANGSDGTYIWAQSGIESVNFSVGNRFEHTEAEESDVDTCYGTYKFLLEILNHAGW